MQQHADCLQIQYTHHRRIEGLASVLIHTEDMSWVPNVQSWLKQGEEADADNAQDMDSSESLDKDEVQISPCSIMFFHSFLYLSLYFSLPSYSHLSPSSFLSLFLFSSLLVLSLLSIKLS